MDAWKLKNQDPYCKIRCGRKEEKSVTKNGAGCNPVWHQMFTFEVEPEDTVLHVEIWDRDTITSDDMIGHTEVDLTQVRQPGKHTVHAPVFRKSSWPWGSSQEKQHGTLILELELKPRPWQPPGLGSVQLPLDAMPLPQSISGPLPPVLLPCISSGLPPHHQPADKLMPGNPPAPAPPPLAQQASLSQQASRSCRYFTYEQLQAATAGFAPSCEIGKGGFGRVYRGMLEGWQVAIKCMDTSEQAMQGLQEFRKEVDILSSVQHPNIVQLLGSCPERGILVYELMEKGSLEDHLFRRGSGGGQPLAWRDRLRITLEVGLALECLHTNRPQPIVHMDMKPANVLLDRDMHAKLSDVGLSRMLPAAAGTSIIASMQASRLVGTHAYMDPEFMRDGTFSPKSDVYSMGMVMMQLLTGRDAAGLVGKVEEAVGQAARNWGPIAALIDKRAGQWPVGLAIEYAKLSLQMVHFVRGERPDLSRQILPVLRGLMLENAGS